MTQADRHERRRKRLALAGGAVGLLVVLAVLLATRAGVGCWRDEPPSDFKPARLSEAGPDAAPPADLMEGFWEGEWFEEGGKLGGKLRCRATLQDDGTYLADFDASFAKVLSFKSSVALKVSKEPGKWHFEGEKDLGWLSGGLYTYKGYATADEFFSTYDSRSHKGVYRMKRAAEPDPATQPDTPSEEGA